MCEKILEGIIMECTQCIENLTAYLDGELTSAESEEIMSHLQTCDSCSAEVGSFQKAADLVALNTGVLETRPGSWEAVRDRINTGPFFARFGFFLPKWSLKLAALVVLAALSIGYAWYQNDQRRALDGYISQYVKSREAAFHLQINNPFTVNPFSENKSGSDTNPFRSEAR
jgi:hypothetical protein